MKRAISMVLAVLLLATSALSAVAAPILYGDVNSDDKINNRDLGTLQRFLNGFSVTIDETAADVKSDDRVNNRDLGLLQQHLNGYDVTLGPEVPAIELPEVGYDIDGRGRVYVEYIYVEDNVLTVGLHNKSTKWITEETSRVAYECTDADGNVLELISQYYGTLYFGMLETDEHEEYKITLPAGTTKFTFGDWYIVYWTQWS